MHDRREKGEDLWLQLVVCSGWVGPNNSGGLATGATETRSNWIRAVSEIPRMFSVLTPFYMLFKMALKGSCKRLCGPLS